MYRAVGPKMRLNLKATAVCLLLHTTTSHCAKQDDEKSPAKEFAAFLKQFGNKETGEFIDKVTNIEGGSHFDNMSNTVKNVFETGNPQKIGYGFMMGYCSGFCVKKVCNHDNATDWETTYSDCDITPSPRYSNALSYNGFIKVDYDGVQKKIESELDFNHDGKVDSEDVVLAYNELNKVLSFNMPSGGGFAAGLAMGLRG